MKKKICFLLPKLGEGGAERVALHLVNNLDLEKFEIYLVLIYKDRGDYFSNLRKEVNCVSLNKEKIRNSIYPIYKILKKINPDFVFIFSFEILMLVGVLIVPFFKKIKFINRQINIVGKLRLSFFRKFLLKRAYENIDKIISQSKDMTDDLKINIRGIESKIVEINNPVDVELIKNLSLKNEKIEYDVNCKNILCVGRLVEQKGFDLIIEVMERLKKEHIKLYILGEGQERKSLEKLIIEKGLENRVFLLGRKNNPYIYMMKADLFILSSRYEGFSNSLLEANLCGTYAICNNCPGGINEIIEEGKNGEIINFKDINKTSEAIIKNLLKPKDREKIRKSIEKRYSIEIIIEKYYKLILGG